MILMIDQAEGISSQETHHVNHLVPVYHYTTEKYLDIIRKEGLQPHRHKSEGAEVDILIDRYAPEGYRRGRSIFTHPNIERITQKFTGADTLIQIMVDPTKVRIADIKYFNLAKESYELADDKQDDPQIKRWGQTYWDTSMPYSDYLALPKEVQEKKYIHPEVLIPYAIAADQITLL